MNLDQLQVSRVLLPLKTSFSAYKKALLKLWSSEINYLNTKTSNKEKCLSIWPISWCLSENWPLRNRILGVPKSPKISACGGLKNPNLGRWFLLRFAQIWIWPRWFFFRGGIINNTPVTNLIDTTKVILSQYPIGTSND